MSSHMGTNFLNSCLKVPIDPCNQCPAPVYNRPKIYFGKSDTVSRKITTTGKESDYDLDMDTFLDTNEVRSLAMFYDSIPDYCELNHLPEQEFYSTLETLKSTCSTLKAKTRFPLVRPVGSQSYSTFQSCTLAKPCKSKAEKKYSKNKHLGRKRSTKKECTSISESHCISSYRNLCDRMQILSNKRFDGFKIENISKQQTDRTTQRKNLSLNKSYSLYNIPKVVLDSVKSNGAFERENGVKQENPPNIEKPYPARSAAPTNILRKCFSFNDLHLCRLEDDLRNKSTFKSIHFDETLRKTPSLAATEENPLSTSHNDLYIGSPKASSSEHTIANRKKHSHSKKKDSTSVPFSFLGVNECKLMNKKSSASPVYPVARPNLAATLRAEVSRKKVKELHTNCTYPDRTPQIDWEVRKTPAWKSLSMIESHKEILSLRLATRKAEQALQNREYQLHMELMKQRVKSAPLLLEGTTYWGAQVGKSSHSCHKDSLRHPCENKKKQRRKSQSENKKTFSRNSNYSTNIHDSDDLCSSDRAYL